MKYLAFILLLILFSCEKEDLHCYKCETRMNNEILSTITTCGMTEDDIGDFAQGLEAQAQILFGPEVETECILNGKEAKI